MKKEVFAKNRIRLQSKLQDNSALVLFAGKAPIKSADEAYSFTPNRNFYYLTGIPYENIIVVIENANGVLKETLFIEPSDPVLSRWIGERMGEEEGKNRSGINNIKYVDDFESYVNKMFDNDGIDKLYLDFERRSYDEEDSMVHKFGQTIGAKYPYVRMVNAYNIISELRTVKSEEEIDNMQKAIEITKDGVKLMMQNSKAGMYEYEFEAYFDFVLKSNGVKDYAFKTIAASGKNGTVLHYSENNSKSKENDLILFDLGAQHEYYSADISRTFPVNGKFTDRQKLIYNIVLKAHDEVIKVIKPGVPFKALNERCREVLTAECKKINLIQIDDELSEYYFHGVSHFLGLDTHDVGSRESILVPGMVVTVEPGLYITEEEIGIRIEDDVLVTEDGCRVLSDSFLTKPEEIEIFMKNKD